MATRIWISMFVGLLVADATVANVTILNETFDSYTDQAAFEAVWQPAAGAANNGFLVPDSSIPGLTPPNDDPPGIEGKAVNVFQGINTYVGPATAQMETLAPTATQNVRYSVDIFEDGQGNKTVTAGLRNSSTPSNIGSSPVLVDTSGHESHLRLDFPRHGRAKESWGEGIKRTWGASAPGPAGAFSRG